MVHQTIKPPNLSNLAGSVSTGIGTWRYHDTAVLSFAPD